MAAINFVPHKCCCAEIPAKEEMSNESSCCAMKHEEKKEHKKDQCDISKMNNVSLTTCGCVHKYTSTDESTLVTLKDHSLNSLVAESTVTEQADKKLLHSYSRLEVPDYTGTIPIYISVSSYLI